MKALALALLLTQTPDKPLPADAPTCESKLEATGRALVGKDAQIAALEGSLNSGVQFRTVVIASSVALVVGVGLGVAVGFAVKK